jgi:hypothetical protein
MADYFTKFSVVLDLKEPEQQAYAMDLADKAARYRTDDSPVPADFPTDLVEVLEDWTFETEKDTGGVWLQSDYGGIDAVCAFIQHLLQKFKPQGNVSFEWSHDCSKPRADAYGGGAAYITAHEIKTMNTSDWLNANRA